MNSTAVIIMAATMLLVTSVTGYFFIRVLKTPPKPEPDSYSENDDQKR